MSIQSVEVIPGIFEKDFTRIEERVRLVSPFVNWIQIDIADNKLVPNTSFLDPEPFRKLIAETGVNYELHMMIREPFLVVEKWVDVGFRRVLLHVESDSRFKIYDLGFTNEIAKLREKIEVGLAVDKNTPVDVVYPYLDDVDCVLVMTIAAGFSGQKFIPDTLDKVRAIRERKPDLPVEVDGGINDQTAKWAIEAGATRLVSTSAIFNSGNIEKAIVQLKQIM